MSVDATGDDVIGIADDMNIRRRNDDDVFDLSDDAKDDDVLNAAVAMVLKQRIQYTSNNKSFRTQTRDIQPLSIAMWVYEFTSFPVVDAL